MFINHPVMITFQFIFILITTLIQICLSSNDTHYTAAVVEYNFNFNSSLTSEERTNAIITDFIDLINFKNKLLDIIIFPESVITSGIRSREELVNLSPLIVNGSNPCENKDVPGYYQRLSCFAKDFNSYLVVNLVEKSPCNQEFSINQDLCASDGYNLYNTNVVFDRSGNIIGRYRKFHLFGEFEKNVTSEVDLTRFTTDFGVTFGTFICFDILFEEPPLWLTRNGTKHLTFPTMWFSEAPFLTALQVQNMFAVATDSVLLASGANYPSIGSGGSGFFIGVEGPKNIGIVPKDGNKVFIADLPKDLNGNSPRNEYKKTTNDTKRSITEIDKLGRELDHFYLKRDHLDVYTTRLIKENSTFTSCHEEFCCKFTIEFTKMSDLKATFKYYRYRTFVFSGVRSFDGVYNGGVEICAISFCRDDTLESCGRRIIPYDDIEWNVTFNRVEISGVYDVSNRKMQYPNSLLSNLEPLDGSEYNWWSNELGNGKIEKGVRLVERQERLMTFGVYGRDFTRDSFP